MNILEFAIKMELDGKSFYEKLANSSKHPGLKAIFSRLARDEQKHCDTLLDMQGGTKEIAMTASYALEFARNVFEEIPKGSGARIEGDLESYRYAMKIEADSHRLYEDAAREEMDPHARELLLQIAAEEYKHFQILENVYTFVNAPNQYLAWGEFSNVEEFRNFGRDVGLG